MEYDMTRDDVDRKEETKIATVEVTYNNSTVWKRSFFVNDGNVDLSDLIDDIALALRDYDEAK